MVCASAGRRARAWQRPCGLPSSSAALRVPQARSTALHEPVLAATAPRHRTTPNPMHGSLGHRTTETTFRPRATTTGTNGEVAGAVEEEAKAPAAAAAVADPPGAGAGPATTTTAPRLAGMAGALALARARGCTQGTRTSQGAARATTLVAAAAAAASPTTRKRRQTAATAVAEATTRKRRQTAATAVAEATAATPTGEPGLCRRAPRPSRGLRCVHTDATIRKSLSLYPPAVSPLSLSRSRGPRRQVDGPLLCLLAASGAHPPGATRTAAVRPARTPGWAPTGLWKGELVWFELPSQGHLASDHAASGGRRAKQSPLPPLSCPDYVLCAATAHAHAAPLCAGRSREQGYVEKLKDSYGFLDVFGRKDSVFFHYR